MPLTMRVKNPADPYASLLERAFMLDFPANQSNHRLVLDAVTDALVSSGQNRFGPTPNPEQMVSIREVVRRAIQADQPINILVPWGSRKATTGRTVDVAELFALRQLQCLVRRVTQTYPAGVRINIQIEDLGGQFLWSGDPLALKENHEYTQAFVALVGALDLGPAVEAHAESERLDLGRFAQSAQHMADLVGKFLLSGGDAAALNTLNKEGWVGDIPAEQVDFYLNQYERMYPHASRTMKLLILANYLGQSWARYALNLKTHHGWDKPDFLILSFPPPVPGMPQALAMRRLFYRTLPMRYARTHIPAWRAVGYFEVRGDTALPKIVSWTDPVVANLTPIEMEVSNDSGSVTVASDYLIAD